MRNNLGKTLRVGREFTDEHDLEIFAENVLENINFSKLTIYDFTNTVQQREVVSAVQDKLRQSLADYLHVSNEREGSYIIKRL